MSDPSAHDDAIGAAAVAVLDAGDALVQALATLAMTRGRLTESPAWDAIQAWASASTRLHSVIDGELGD